MTYREAFNHLGEPCCTADFRISDLVICSIAFAVISALFSWVLT